jgi:hypothetical protein
MAEVDSLLSQLPEPLHQKLVQFQMSQGHESLLDALAVILQSYFEAQSTEKRPSSESNAQVQELEKRVVSMTRELFALRQEVPNQCDRLREQLAAVRLSHSGMLQNLRERIEELERALPVKSAE